MVQDFLKFEESKGESDNVRNISGEWSKEKAIEMNNHIPIFIQNLI